MTDPFGQTLAIIPARAGSKAQPGKNLMPLGGKPMIAHTLAAALSSRLVARTVVSTEDDQIARVGLACGAEVPFRRDPALAEDGVSNLQVFIDAIEQMRSLGCPADWAVLLQPTSPLRTAADIDAAGRRMLQTGADAVVSVCPARPHPWLAMQIDADGWISPAFFDGPAQPARQRFRPMYYLNGAIYLVRIEPFLQRRSMYGPRTTAYLMPAERSVDVDSLLDLRICELLLKDQCRSEAADPDRQAPGVAPAVPAAES
ncbi:MAG: cytidylyltransferase domain-containing protein [Phycisphaerae bacterium]